MAAAADCQQIVAPCVACVALQVPQRQRQHVKISKLEILVRNVTNSYLISYLHTDLTLQTLNCAPNIIYEQKKNDEEPSLRHAYRPTYPFHKTHPYSKCYRLSHKGYSHVSVSISEPRVPLPAKFSSRPFKFLLFCSVELQSYAAYGAAIARAFWMLLPDSQINVCLSCYFASYLVSCLLLVVLRGGSL